MADEPVQVVTAEASEEGAAGKVTTLTGVGSYSSSCGQLILGTGTLTISAG